MAKIQEFEAARDRMNGNRWGVFGNRCRCFVSLGGGRRYCEKKAEELNKQPWI